MTVATSRRTERVSRLLRDVVGEVVLSKLSDPRIDPARTSVTRVEMPEDLLSARVFVSVMGTESEQRRTLQALRHAAGHIQELAMRGIRLRHTPILQFEADVRFKRTLETLDLIEQAMAEIRGKEEAQQADEEPSEDPGATAAGANQELPK